MADTFFDAQESFPHPLKVRFPKGEPVKVRLTVHDLVSQSNEPAEAGFEVVILDHTGYMESTTVYFSSFSGGLHYDVPCLSVDTSAVYVLPLQASNDQQRYQVTATT